MTRQIFIPSRRKPSFSDAMKATRSKGRNSLDPASWSGLLGLWSGLQAAGHDWYDLSGIGKTGLLVNMPVTQWGVFTGKAGLAFDGNDDYVELGQNDDYNFGTGGSFTAMSGVRLDGEQPAALGYIIGKGGLAGNTPGFAIYTSSEAVSCQIRDSSDNIASIDSGHGINDGAWHCVAITVDRISETLTLFVDGVITGTPASTASVGSISNTTQPVQLGERFSSTTSSPNDRIFQLDGQIALAGMWNRVLLPSRIYHLWARPDDLLRPQALAVPASPAAGGVSIIIGGGIIA